MDERSRLILIAIVAVAFTIETALGFGATVVTVAIGSMLAPIDVILPVFVPLNIVLSAALVVRGFRAVAWRELATRIAPLLMIGFPFGIMIGRVAPERFMKLGFGCFILALATKELAPRRTDATAPPVPPPAVERIMLLLGGVVHGAFATGGPLVVYVAGRRLGGDKAVFRSTLSVLWLVMNSVLAATYVWSRQITRESLSTTATLSIGLLAGLGLGELAFARVSAARFRVLVYAMLAVAGAVLIVRNALA